MTDPNALSGMTGEEKRELLTRLLREKAAKSKSVLPLSHGQQALWLIHQLAPESSAYHIAFYGRIYSPIDVPAFKRALQTLMDRHSILRTVFSTQDGLPLAEIYQYREVELEQVDANGWNEDQLREQVLKDYHTPFDFEAGPLIRWKLYNLSPTDHFILLAVHHIIFDGWSTWLLLNELRQLYTGEISGKPATLPKLEIQYSDYVKWQADMLSSSRGEELRQYWQQKLNGALTELNLPLDHPRPLVKSYEGAQYEVHLNEEPVKAIRALAQAENTTSYVVLLAMFQALLHRYTGQMDILIGSPFAGRSRAEFASLVGYFVNPVVMRAQFETGMTFRDFLKQVRQTVLETLEHQDYPFIKLVEEMSSRQNYSSSPIFQVAFNLLRMIRTGDTFEMLMGGQAGSRTNFAGMELEAVGYPQEEGQFDLELHFIEFDTIMRGALKYSADIFEPATIERMWGHFQTLLAGVTANPEQRIIDLPLLTQPEFQQLMEWNNTRVDYPQDICLHQLFEAQVERTPDAIAVTFEDVHLTYQELNQRANQLAHYLRGLGVGPGTLVGVCLERTAEMLAALLGILKAGGAYVPMDPEYPRERLGYMLEDGHMTLIVTQEKLLERLPEHQAQTICLDTDSEAINHNSNENLRVSLTGNDLVYVIFTSGSTGRPKGVQIPHRALANFLLSMQKEPGITAQDVLASVTTLSFDIAGLEMYLPLISGAQVVIVSRDVAVDGNRLAELLDAVGATIIQATPVTYRLLIDCGWNGRQGLKILVGGESVPRKLVDELLRVGGEVWNMYGPTETTIWSTLCRLTADDPIVSIGHPIANTQIYILDANLSPVPVGVPGTLYIGGDGLARGYINRPDLTAERFIANPFVSPEARIYNTGDLARYLPQGQLEHLGRVDHQVKIRGYRIELGEIESAMNLYPGVRESLVTLREDNPDDRRLVAYLVADSNMELSDLKSALKHRLPAYMIPSAFVMLDAMPLTPNGKVDRKALPPPEYSNHERTQVVMAHTPTEILVSEVWKEVLGVDQISVYDNFFDLGGHSLTAVQVTGKLESKTGLKIDPALIRFQTLGQLAASYDEMQIQKDIIPVPAQTEIGLTQRIFRAFKRSSTSTK